MQITTLIISIISSILICFVKPIQALSIYLAIFLLYPQWLSVQIGTYDFTSGRILIIVIFLRHIVNINKIKHFKYNILDIFVLLYFINRFIASSINIPFPEAVERESGRFVDIILVYFIARFLITSKSEFISIIKTLIWIAIPLALLGIYQSLTGTNFYDFMLTYHAWESLSPYMVVRHGLYRANVNTDTSIIFGLFFAGIIPLILGLWKTGAISKIIILILSCIALCGLISSMSSAPLFSIVVSFLFLALYPLRKYNLIIIIYIMSTILFVEYYSNRHWYDVLSRFAFSSRTADYRIELIKEAFSGGMDNHWIAGWGYVGPYEDDETFPWEHKDMVNIYIGILAGSGLLGLIPYVLFNFFYYLKLYQAFKYSTSYSDKWLIWCLSSSLVGWNIAMLTTSMQQPLSSLFYLLIGVVGSLSINSNSIKFHSINC